MAVGLKVTTAYTWEWLGMFTLLGSTSNMSAAPLTFCTEEDFTSILTSQGIYKWRMW